MRSQLNEKANEKNLNRRKLLKKYENASELRQSNGQFWEEKIGKLEQRRKCRTREQGGNACS